MQTPSSVSSAAHMAEYRLSPAAERDLEGIWKYTRREWGLKQAERYTDLLTAAFQPLVQPPMLDADPGSARESSRTPRSPVAVTVARKRWALYEPEGAGAAAMRW